MHGLVHAELLLSKEFEGGLEAKRFERSYADPCLFRRQRQGNVALVFAVYIDDLPLLSAMEEDGKQAPEHLRSSVPIKDFERVSYYQGCRITRNQEARTVTFD